MCLGYAIYVQSCRSAQPYSTSRMARKKAPGGAGIPPPQEPGSRHDAPDHAARLQALDEEADEI